MIVDALTTTNHALKEQFLNKYQAHEFNFAPFIVYL